MNVLSLFDGMSCGQIALNKGNIDYDNYYASEIDNHAIKVTQANYPNTIQLGDVAKWREWKIDWSSIGILLAGSPCQGFSFAGKQLAFDDPRSALFFVFVEIWEHIQKHNPKAKYLLENVKMKKEYELIISKYMGINPIEINSSLLTAQNRVRLYWTNIENEPFGLFGNMTCTIPQPKDKGILLLDILENDVDDKYYLSEKMIKCLSSRVLISKGYEFKPGFGNYKANCVLTKEGQYSTCNFIITHSTQPRNGKGNGGKGHLMKKDNKSYCVDTSNSQAIEYNYNIRRLTPIECERLQSVPDNYTNYVSDSQRYKMLGNGWTVDVIVYILSFMNK
jgi:DNA-cytosine methyltransferase